MSDTLADVATAIALGCRNRQEDALVTQFSNGADTGFAVLSDGMGGHDDGDLAARIIVSEIFGSICLAGRSDARDQCLLRDRLQMAILAANQGLRDQIDAGFGQNGMGGTAIASIVQDGNLSWISIGDSGLYLFRDDQLTRLNEVHSLAAQIDLMARKGEISEETARTHPQRSCLTSALVGAEINRVDCPTDPIALKQGDIILMASDGLEVLDTAQTCAVLSRLSAASSQEISQALLQAVAEENAPDQDNVSLIVIKPKFGETICDAATAGPASRKSVIAPLRQGIADLRQNLALYLGSRSAL